MTPLSSLIGLALLLLLAGCTQAPPPPPPPLPPCSTEPLIPVAADQVSWQPSSLLNVVDAQYIDSLAHNQVVVTQGSYEAGQLLLANCNDGLLRRIAGVSQVSVQGLRKIYLQTETAGLEQAIERGRAEFQFGELPLEAETTTSAWPGVTAVGGKVNFKNVTWSPQPGVKITLNGYIAQTFNPQFGLRIEQQTLQEFTARLAGNLTANLQASISANSAALLPAVGSEKTLATFAIRRAFLLGGVPVVVVVEPKVVVGAEANLGAGLTAQASITPSLAMMVGIEYRNRAWNSLFQPPSFALKPALEVIGAAGSTARVYSRIDFDLKFYGLLGPRLSAEPYLGLTLRAEPASSSLRAGLLSSVGVQAGFSVLGQNLAVAYSGPSQDVGQGYSCTLEGCQSE